MKESFKLDLHISSSLVRKMRERNSFTAVTVSVECTHKKCCHCCERTKWFKRNEFFFMAVGHWPATKAKCVLWMRVALFLLCRFSREHVNLHILLIFRRSVWRCNCAADIVYVCMCLWMWRYRSCLLHCKCVTRNCVLCVHSRIRK